MKPGDPFNPYGMFNGLFVPEALARCRGLSPGAKLAYGRLTRYAGQNGECYPSTDTLGAELGINERQARRYIAELESNGFIRRLKRFRDGAQTSNGFQFRWHRIFDTASCRTEPERGQTDVSGGRRTDVSAGGRTDASGEESHSEDSHSEEEKDIDCLLTNRKRRDSQSDVVLSDSRCQQYPRLREYLAQYMLYDQNDEKVYPTDRQVVEVIDSAEGANEKEIIHCLLYLRNTRGLRPGTRNGPRQFAWFPTVVGEYFRKKRQREEAANPSGYHEWSDRNDVRLSKNEFDAMTEAIEIDGSV